jgi:hypothetical protein
MRRCFLLLPLFLLPFFGFAQSTSATISGGVTDSSGSFILGADVEIANDATGVIYSAKTNSSGMYLVPILPPGQYHVQVSKRGFKTIRLSRHQSPRGSSYQVGGYKRDTLNPYPLRLLAAIRP